MHVNHNNEKVDQSRLRGVLSRMIKNFGEKVRRPKSHMPLPIY